MRVFSTIVSWSNENKSCVRLDESWRQTRARVAIFINLLPSSFDLAVVVDRLCRDVEMLNACVEIPTFSRGNYLLSL